ncbi:MAG: alpha/beta fold hydrolase [Planctomycetota bacterium]|nr:MAG: alpha/beta fold hydrolase [Planctomycetota bacterium]
MMPLHHVAVRDTRLAVHTRGGGLPLLLLHAFPLDHSMWERQAPLADSLRLIAPDQRGFGASRGSPPQSIEQLADDAVALLDALHVAAPAVVCGVSMGGYVAQHVATRHPDRVAALVLVDTKLEADTPEARAGRADLAAKVGRLGPSILADAMVPRLLAAATPAPAADRADVEDLLRRTITTQPVDTIQAALAALGARPDMTDAMRRVRVPTLLVVGAEDAITPPACMEAAMQVLPGARLLVVPGAGHMTPLERPDVFNASLLEFLREALPAGHPHQGRP